MDSKSDNIVAETATRIFADLADPQTINQSETKTWVEPLWRALTDAGLPLAWVPDDLGGAGASLADGFAVLRVAGRFALAVPFAETLTAGWLLARAGIKPPTGAMTVAPVRPNESVTLNSDGTLSGRVTVIPFARGSEHVAVYASSDKGNVVALVKTAALQLTDGENLAGEPLDEISFDRIKPLHYARAPAGCDKNALMLIGSVVRSVQTAGALEAILAMSVRYANERVAFERPIGKFQAVQQNLARLAGETAAALASSGSAADALANASETGGDFDDAIFLEAASAKIRCAEAAAEGAAIAHQVHGAIGFTEEHILHRFTLRMLGWRDDFGNESYWAVMLGKLMAGRRADNFWPLIASR